MNDNYLISLNIYLFTVNDVKIVFHLSPILFKHINVFTQSLLCFILVSINYAVVYLSVLFVFSKLISENIGDCVFFCSRLCVCALGVHLCVDTSMIYVSICTHIHTHTLQIKYLGISILRLFT